MNKTNIEHPTSNSEHRRRGGAAVQIKTPNPKTQIPNKPQTSISNGEPPQRGLEFDAWDFFGAWGLEFGNSASDRQGTTDRGPRTTDN